MEANFAGALPQACHGAVRWGQQHPGAARHPHRSGVPATIPVQALTLDWPDRLLVVLLVISRGHIWLESRKEELRLDGWPSSTEIKVAPCPEPESCETLGPQHLKSEYFNLSVLSSHNTSRDCTPVQAQKRCLFFPRGHRKLEKAALRENYTNNSDRLAKRPWTGRVRRETMGSAGPSDWSTDAQRSLEFGCQRTRGGWTDGYGLLTDVELVS